VTVETKWRLFNQNITAYVLYAENFVITLVFKKSAACFRKLAKIAKISDQNIDPCLHEVRLAFLTPNTAKLNQ
jgi:hypothetical protein